MNKRLWWFPMAMIIVSVVGPAQALDVFDTGDDLFARCTSSGPFQQQDRAYCIAYIDGIAADLDVQGAPEPSVCIPLGVTKGQARDVVIDYLRRNPKSRSDPAAGLIRIALMRAWPCH